MKESTPPLAPDEGFVTVAVLGLLMVLLAVAGLVATLSAVAVARHRAAATADLSALAAAGHAFEGELSACRAARIVAHAQGGAVRSCRLSGLEALVEVAVRPPGPLGQWGEARSVARAGPTRLTPVG